jgi:hypothetical protein
MHLNRRYIEPMKDETLDMILVVTAGLLMLISVDFANSTRFLWPGMAFLKEHLVAIVVALVVIVTVSVIMHEPRIRWR